MSDRFYQAVRHLAAPFAFHCRGLGNVRNGEPGLFVANHLGATGPIQVFLSVPLRMHPWIAAEMTDPSRAPRFLYERFVGPSLHLYGHPGLALAAAMALIAVPLINRLQCIPVDLARGRYLTPFRRGLSVLKEGGNVLVFPEDPAQPPDPETKISPFRCGFLLLCHTYRQHTGRTLPVYPIAVSARSRTVAIGEPIIAHGGCEDSRHSAISRYPHGGCEDPRHSAISHCPLPQDLRRTGALLRAQVQQLYRSL